MRPAGRILFSRERSRKNVIAIRHLRPVLTSRTRHRKGATRLIAKIDKIDKIERLDRLLRSVNHSIMSAVRSTVGAHGIPHHGLAAMRYVHMQPGITVSEIARQSGMAKSNVSKTVDSLVQLNMLEKRSDPSDQRLVRLHVTPRAEEHFQAVHNAVRDRLGAMLASLRPGQVDTLIDALAALETALAASDDTPRARGDGEHA